MNRPTLVIANRNYSSWSLRPWLVLTAAGVEFDEVLVQLGTPETEAAIRRWSPSGRVPAYRDGEIVVWDSLAICEHVAETHPGANLWPVDPVARAIARSVTAEMHSGFSSLRQNMTMNIRASYPGKGRGEGVDADIARITAIWNDCRTRFGAGGTLLFGRFTIADAFFAPVVSRFRTYGVELSGPSADYAEAVWALPAMQDWVEKARAEPWKVARYEL